MRSRLIGVILAVFSIMLLSSCFVRHPGPVHNRNEYRSGPRPGRHHRGRNCRQVCSHWGNARDCQRRCATYANGVCVRWHEHCSNRRVCRGETTRCD